MPFKHDPIRHPIRTRELRNTSHFGLAHLDGTQGHQAVVAGFFDKAMGHGSLLKLMG